MFFFTSRSVKQGQSFLKDAKKLLAYKRDLWSDAQVADFEDGIRQLEEAIKSSEKSGISINRLRTLVFSDGAGPNAQQRKALADYLNGRPSP
ncbi:MAG: hypothetical protein V4710_24525, partial [Verrucomicrobiota bacterium]